MLPIVELVRLQESYEHGTFGVLKINKELFCVTLEPRDEENAQMISSIPAQQYMCERIVSPTHGETYEIKNVPGRSEILFHCGNIDNNTKGCVLLGTGMGFLPGHKSIVGSRDAFVEFMKRLNGYQKFSLTVSEVF